jgi:hypothetical protein
VALTDPPDGQNSSFTPSWICRAWFAVLVISPAFSTSPLELNVSVPECRN